MAEVALDANVLIALLDEGDSLHLRALDLIDRLESEGHDFVLLDVCLMESVSVLGRRTEERTKRQAAGRQTKPPPDLDVILDRIGAWFQEEEIRWITQEAQRLCRDVLTLIRQSRGSLNFNDALIVAAKRNGVIDSLASFDEDFDQIEGFKRIR